MKSIIKCISGVVHDTSYGGYPYKVIVEAQFQSAEYNSFKKKIKREQYETY